MPIKIIKHEYYNKKYEAANPIEDLSMLLQIIHS